VSVSHSFSMSTPSPVEEIAREVDDLARSIDLFDAPVTPERLLDEDGVLTRRGMWIRVLKTNPRPYDPLITDLGITPTVRVAFMLDKTTSLSEQEDDIIHLVALLLDRVPGDAVLQYHYEIIWLLRHGDDLTLNDREEKVMWPQHRLSHLRQPFGFTTFPTL
jgi:hypothetical protein